MISTDKLNAVKTVVVHDNCSDGLASAILVKDAFYGRDIKFKFVQYNTDEFRSLRAEPGMMFVDFSPPPERAQEFIDAGTLVLDHHRTAKAMLVGFGENAIFGDEKENPGVCGARLAYEHVWLPLRAELTTQAMFADRFSRLAGVRDTWQRQSPEWTEACKQGEILNFMPRERWMAKTLTQIASEWDGQFSWIGDVLWDKHTKAIAKCVQGAHRFTTYKGTRAVVFEGVRNSSDAAEALGDTADLVIGFAYFVEPLDGESVQKMVLSTRSHTHYDCSALSKHYGGGGHTKAAGFNHIMSRSDPNPYAQIEALINLYEITLPSS